MKSETMRLIAAILVIIRLPSVLVVAGINTDRAKASMIKQVNMKQTKHRD